MKLIISNEIRAKYPALRMGIVVASAVNNAESEALTRYVREAFAKFKGKYASDKELQTDTNICAWQEIYRSFGVNPKKKMPTAEALLSRVIKSDFVPHINAAVDSYLVAETLHCLPIGGYDLDKISGDIVLRFSQGNESFTGIGGDEAELTSLGEVVYADAARILTRRWNYRDCEHSKIDLPTQNLALFVEAPVAEILTNAIEETLGEIEKNLTKYCAAKTKSLFLNVETNEVEL